VAQSSGNDQLINLQAQQLAAQVANWAAQLEFQKERMRLLELPEMQGKLQVDIDKLAWQKAQDTWERAIKEATLTGKYNGQDTLEWLTQQAQMTGVLNGQQTLQGKLTDAQIAQMNNSMRLANDQFVTNTTGYFNGQKTFDREKFEAGQAQDAWKFLSTLTGPSNAFKQAKAIGNMPGGMQGIMQAWAGQYSPAGFGAVGSGGQATMESLLGGGGPGSPYSYYPPPGGLAGPSTATGYPGVGGYPYPGGGGTTAPPAGPGVIPPGAGAPSPGAGAPTAGTPTGGAPAAPPPGAPPPGAPTAGAGMDAGFYIWLSHHGVTPGDPNMIGRMDEFFRNYQSLPPADHQAYIDYGRAHPAEHRFDLTGWANVPGLPAYNLGDGMEHFPIVQPDPGSPPDEVTTPTQPTLLQPSPPPADNNIPGRGWPESGWNDATRAGVAAWNAAHPGWIADGSAAGFHLAPGYQPPSLNVPNPDQGLHLGTGGYPEGAAGGYFTRDPGPSQWAKPNPDMYLDPSLGTAPAGPAGAFTPPNASEMTALSPQEQARYLQLIAYQRQLAASGSTTGLSAADLAEAQGYQDRIQASRGTDPNMVSAQGVSTSSWGEGAQNPYSYQGAGVQAPVHEWNYALSPTGSVQVYPPGVSSNYSTPDISSPTPMSPGNAANLYSFGAQQPAANQPQGQAASQAAASTDPYANNPWMQPKQNLPLPNQINARNYNNSYQYQRELGWAGYEDAGWDKGLAQEAFARSLPKTGGPKKGSFAF